MRGARLSRAAAAATLLLCLLALGQTPAGADVTPQADTPRTTHVSEVTQPLPEPSPVVPQVFVVKQLDARPPGFTVTARQAIRIADRVPKVQHEKQRHSGLHAIASISALPLASGAFYHWRIEYQLAGHEHSLAEVEIGPDGHVYEATTGVDVGWGLVHGYKGTLGHKLNAPYVWLPLCAIFLLPFLDFRRLRRLLHLDLLMLLGFGVSQYFFNLGKPWISTPLIYPVLAYFAVRLLVAGFRPRARPGPLIPHMGTGMVALLIAMLIAGKVVFSLVGSGTIDVAFAGVVGADRIEHGLPLYTDNSYHPDTYGPINYLAYVPFELVFPYKGNTDRLPNAELTTLMFDFLTALGLFLLGRHLRSGREGTRLGLALTLGWTAYPYTGLVIASNTNDAIVPLFVVYALLLVTSRVGRAAALGLATMAKFLPGLLAPAFAGGLRRLTLRDALVFSIVFALVCVAILAPFIPDGGLRALWNTTIGFQLSRTSPLTIWGRQPELDWLQTALKVGFIAYAASLAWWPRRRSVGQLAALCGVALVGTQMVAGYWLYFYAVWFAPLVLIAIFLEQRELGPYGPSVTSDFVKPVRMSQPESVTTTRSSILTPSEPGT